MASAAARLREAIAARAEALQVDGAPRFTRVQRDPMPHMEPDNLPALAVFLLRQNDIPDGDGNVGDIRFVSDITIALHFMRRGGLPADARGLVDDDVDAVLNACLTDPEFTSFGPDALFESIEQMERSRSMPQEGDAYYAFVGVNITFRTRVSFEPVVTDRLDKIVMTTRPINRPKAPAITTEIDFPQDETP